MRNAVPGDVVLILDKESPKGKFVIGTIDSVKEDKDQRVRKVVVKYKLRSATNNFGSTFKYADRNIRGLALLVKAEERCEDQLVDMDENRFRDTVYEEDKEETEQADQSAPEESNEENLQAFDARALAPTSSGRKRRLPARFI